MRRSRRGGNPASGALDTASAQETSRPALHRGASKRSRRGGLGNIVVMTLASGLVATMAIPAYAFAPGSNETDFKSTASTELTKSGAQAVDVDAQAATVTVARDGFTATTHEELAATAAAAAAATRRTEVAAQMTSYATSFSGPSAAELIAQPSHPSVDLGAVFSAASQFQGVPYVYGGATPAGFDCSGLIMYVYAKFGISLPHSSNGQGAAGTRIPLAQAQPGDLIVMPGHIGFYAGNGNMLHAPYEGAAVRIQPIWSSDYFVVRL